MPYDLNSQWGERSGDVKASGCLGCLLITLCCLAIDAAFIAAVAYAVRLITS